MCINFLTFWEELTDLLIFIDFDLTKISSYEIYLKATLYSKQQTSEDLEKQFETTRNHPQ